MASPATAVTIERVPPHVTYGLRQRVLRAGRGIGAVRLDVDDDPHTAAFVARDAAGTVVATAIVFPDPCPWLVAAELDDVRADIDTTVIVAHADGDDTVPHVPSPTTAQRSWRLRGMATEPSWRGHGVGRQILDRVIEHVRVAGGTVVWCKARLPARRFYERAGFTVHGEPWVDPDIGPHVAMWRTL